MARHNPHAALTDELVALLTPYSPISNSRAFAACVDASTRTLRSHRYGRTNQFAVDQSMHGLVERFDVQGHEALAAALQERMHKLSSLEYKLTPEVLSLLLHLSDHPAEQSNVDRLDLLKEPEDPPEITWSDIVRDDPLPESDIWDAPDYHNTSSDDDVTLDSRGLSRISEGTGSSSVENDSHANGKPHLLLQEPDFAGLDALRQEQTWRGNLGKPDATSPTEFQVVRECLHMLLGKPTILFDKARHGKQIVPMFGVALALTSAQSVYHVLSNLADIGTVVSVVRAYAVTVPDSPLLQRFSAIVSQHTRDFDQFLAAVEFGLINLSSDAIVSIVSFETQVVEKSLLLLDIHKIITHQQRPFAERPYLVLDALYDQACHAQLIGNAASFSALSELLSQCLEAYLLPLTDWMDHGDLDTIGDNFLALAEKTVELSSWWKDQYSIRVVDGSPRAPQFLQPFIQAIFAEGKSVALLQRLGLAHLLPAHNRFALKLGVLRAPIIDPDSVQRLVPFAATFHEQIKTLISGKQLRSASDLCQQMLNGLHLRTTFVALQTLYLSRAGSHFANYADLLFSRLSTVPAPNQYVVAEIARSAYASHPAIDEHLITASLASAPSVPLKSLKTLTPISLHYLVPAVLQNIIHPSTLQTYQAIQHTLLSLRLARLLLSSPTFLPALVAIPSPQQSRICLYLRHRFLWLLTTLEDHFLHTAIHLNTLHLQHALDRAADVDALIAAHETFIRTVGQGCLISEGDAGRRGAGRTVATLAALCIAFVRAAKRASGGSAEGATMLAEADETVAWDESVVEADGRPDEPEHDDDEAAPEDPFMDSKPRAPQTTSPRKPKARPISLGPADLDAELRLRQMRTQLADMLAMLTAQLRSAARERVNDRTGWAVLAERLDWGVNYGRAVRSSAR